MMRAGWIIGAVLGAGTSVMAAPALTSAEKQSFRQELAACWNVGGLSSAARKTTVTVAFSMDRRGKPIRDSIMLAGAQDGTSQAAKDAYSAARRAILRCGAKGYKLPLEKYDQWRNIELTFDPGRMRLR